MLFDEKLILFLLFLSKLSFKSHIYQTPSTFMSQLELPFQSYSGKVKYHNIKHSLNLVNGQTLYINLATAQQSKD